MRSRYGGTHKRLRRVWAERIRLGGVLCARCGELIPEDSPAEAWDLGHDDFDETRYSGPEHRRCNRATSGRRSGPRRHSRAW